MNSPKHTPGPWHCDAEDTKQAFPARQRVYAGGSLVAEVAGNGSGQSGFNAKLIAAAPELLAALEEIRGWMLRAKIPSRMRHKDGASPKEAIQFALDAARAAIAKATA